MSATHRRAVLAEFSHQAEAFNRSPTMTSDQTLQALVDLLPAKAGERWLEVACGPGLVARGLAERVGEVVAGDVTPRMLALGRREARAAGLRNVRYVEADATSLPFAEGAFDGAVTRFSLHHIPDPGRVIAEMARVTKVGGHVASSEHLGSPNAAAHAWHEEIERLRDPSHWACLTPKRLSTLGRAAGLRLVKSRVEPFHLDFDEWLERGSTGPANRQLIEDLMERRADAYCALLPGRVLRFRLGRMLWRK